MNDMNSKAQAPAREGRAKRRAAWRGVGTVALLLAAVVALQLLLGLLPATLTRYDVSDNGIFSISDTTKDFLGTLREDVTVYALCSGGRMSVLTEMLLGRYQAASGHIRVVAVDPSADTEFASEYSVVASLSEGSLVVKSDRRYTVVDFESTDYYSVNGVGNVPTAQYLEMISSQELVNAYYTYYGIDMYDAVRLLALEAALTQAIEYVCMATVPHIYVTSANGERVVGSMLQMSFEQTMIEYETIDLTRVSAVPEDASSLLILAPETDFSDEVTQKIRDYVIGGGRLLIATEPKNAGMKNLNALTEMFGARAMEGELLEGNANRYYDAPSTLLVGVNSEHSITYSVAAAGYTPVLPHAHGIELVEPGEQGMTATVLFGTSDSAYVELDGEQTDLGSVAVAVASENATTGARMVWIASTDALDDACVVSYGAATLYYFVQAARWQHILPTSSLGTIQPIDMSEGVMTFNDTTAIGWAGVAVILIPLAFVIAGVSVRIKRARR